MTKKIISADSAIELIPDGSTIMVGGFLQTGGPDSLLSELVNSEKSNFTMITNDTSFLDTPKGQLIANKKIKKVITSHIGANPETGRQMCSGELEVEIVPMGTLVERIRSAGAGLGGVLTPTGVGTIIEEGKQTFEFDGKKFIYDKPIKADFALLYGTKVDKFGNVSYYGTTRNFNTVMATAAETVIVQADEIVDEIPPNDVIIPGIFIDYIVLNEEYECN